MDGIIKIDSKLISTALLKPKSLESISLVMDTYCETAMTSQPLLFVYEFTHFHKDRDQFQKVQRDRNGMILIY